MYELPKLEATRTPYLNHFMLTLCSPATAKVVDMELSRFQAPVLDFLVSLTAILENYAETLFGEVKETSIAVVELIGNAKMKTPCLCGES